MSSTNDKPRCDRCEIVFTKEMQLEYSDELCETYCSPDCATDKYYDHMRSYPITFEEMLNKVVKK